MSNFYLVDVDFKLSGLVRCETEIFDLSEMHVDKVPDGWISVCQLHGDWCCCVCGSQCCAHQQTWRVVAVVA